MIIRGDRLPTRTNTPTLTFALGAPTKSITIEIKGDSKKDTGATLYVDLIGLAGNARFVSNRGLGTILNDDGS